MNVTSWATDRTLAQAQAHSIISLLLGGADSQKCWHISLLLRVLLTAMDALPIEDDDAGVPSARDVLTTLTAAVEQERRFIREQNHQKMEEIARCMRYLHDMTTQHRTANLRTLDAIDRQILQKEQEKSANQDLFSAFFGFVRSGSKVE